MCRTGEMSTMEKKKKKLFIHSNALKSQKNNYVFYIFVPEFLKLVSPKSNQLSTLEIQTFLRLSVLELSWGIRIGNTDRKNHDSSRFRNYLNTLCKKISKPTTRTGRHTE